MKSPQLPKLLEELYRYWEDEQQQRKAFYDWVTPEMKVEFIDGEIVIHSPVRKKHNVVTSLLVQLINVYCIKNHLGFVGYEKIMCRFLRNDYEPDICYFSPEKSSKFTDDQTLFPVPDFIVEVLSESTASRDRGLKFEDYALNGVQEYWIIDADLEIVEQYELVEEAYTLKAKFSNQEQIESIVIKGFSISLKAIFDGAFNVQALQSL